MEKHRCFMIQLITDTLILSTYYVIIICSLFTVSRNFFRNHRNYFILYVCDKDNVIIEELNVGTIFRQMVTTHGPMVCGYPFTNRTTCRLTSVICGNHCFRHNVISKYDYRIMFVIEVCFDVNNFDFYKK